MKKRIFSMINPSSTKGLHIGNYFGMIQPAVKMQDEGECFYGIANIHSLNTVFNPREVEQNTMNIYAEFIALGLDLSKTVFFVESDIPAITYTQTILNNLVTVSELKRMHAFKDKMQNEVDHDAISMGLFSYPVLMAADILAFESDVVPVGADQSQHVEICREIARSFNNRYGQILKIPELYVRKETAKIMGIDGERKMSKSLGNDIPIFASDEEIKRQIMAIKTDPARIHPTDPGNPDKNGAFAYLALLGFDNVKIEDMKERYRKGSIGDVEIKKILYNVCIEYFRPFQKKKNDLLRDGSIHDIRNEGAKKANAVANPILAKIKQSAGLSIIS